MKLKRIEELFETLPPNAAYFWNQPAVNSNHLSTEFSRLAKVESDPAFPWNYVNSWVNDELPMPLEAREDYMRRAYDILRGYTKPSRDKDMRAAIMVGTTTEHRYKRDIIRFHLLAPGVTLEKIADVMTMSVESVHLFEQLFWNVRDRMDEVTYIAKLAWPEGRTVSYMPGYINTEDPAKLMLRSTLDFGPDDAKAIAGLPTAQIREHDADMEISKLKAHILSNANMLARMGGLNQRSVPGIGHAKSLMVAIEASGNQAQLNDDAVKGLGAVSMHTSILDHIVKLQAPDIKARIALQQSNEDAIKREAKGKP